MMNISLLQKYNKPGPRYTSYPPATFFHDGVSAENYKTMVVQSNLQQPENISLYLHVPFCKQLCHFCGCNTSCFPGNALIEQYMEAMAMEISSVSELLDTSRPLTQIHWGGGTPNSIDLKHVEKIMNTLLRTFNPAPKAEIAMECNPAYLNPEHIDQLASMGFNRLSLGIQDFNEEVLKLVNRKPSLYPVEKLISHMKSSGMEGVNMDLIYGLPGQTPASFKETIRKAIDVSPDRIVTFSYAHVPWVKSAQKVLEDIGLPKVEDKLAMFETAYNLLTENGYIAIGMDHYAKPGDELTIAMKNKKLHRNFQGYCTRETTGQVYGFGATSISQLQGGYYQNIKDTTKYIDSINQTGFAIERGYELTPEDTIRRTVINEIMCNGFLDFNDIAGDFGITTKELKTIVGYNKEKLKPYLEDGLLEIGKDHIRLKENGFLVVRNIAMEFDPLLSQSTNGQFSKTV
ncbi:MAG: oxygen-independent coproporphyrinogen III oxidase [Bacteroidetes bacterium]|nr:MAG: oxygen-independent coproporphyrinogen III oxidase [Bacteroidota bacterium]